MIKKIGKLREDFYGERKPQWLQLGRNLLNDPNQKSKLAVKRRTALSNFDKDAIKRLKKKDLLMLQSDQP